MGIKQEIEARGLEREALLLMNHAAEAEGRAPSLYRTNPQLYYRSLERIEQHRAEARQLRQRAAALRKQS